ncbi:MAG: hypothetical protein GX458_13145 [Phyllobacteriaceae bacterium]|nr:hypothetical protein [Phyllobacteriaceae bacterium]
MNSMVRERESHVSRLFIEVTPGIRRALELLAEASITLLDEIDAPVDELEADPDFEWLAEDDEDGHDAEPEEDEPELGWTEDGQIGSPDDWTGSGRDEDFVEPETSGGFPRAAPRPYEERAVQKALFDPRIARRGMDAHRAAWTNPAGDILGFARIPTFPHDLPGRSACVVRDEIRRLNMELWPKVAKRRRISVKKT